MLFNSFDFAVFFPLFFIIYWIVVHRRLWLQNLIIILGSYIFYAWWDWRFLSLIIFSSIVDFLVGMGLSRQYDSQKRKLLLLISIFVNIGFLGFFKYYNFFVESFTESFSFFGYPIQGSTLNIILPVGISFYTFQTLSYTIDVYRKKLKPTRNIIAFFAFVSFFPQLVAGPIERATHFLPQFFKKRSFDYSKAVIGIRQILWGFFMKLVIADRLAIYVDVVYGNAENHNSITLMVATIFFAFQIYCDFAGYSYIAIGLGKLLGFDLMTNFNRPYFSSSISEFWKRWHISLSTWFRDYVYIPLGGNRVSKYRNYFNLFITFIVSGLWHGAAWTFVLWGGINGTYLILDKILNNSINKIWAKLNFNRKKLYRNILSFITTFTLINFAWIFFRSGTVNDAFIIIQRIFTAHGSLYLGKLPNLIYSFFGIGILLYKEIDEEFLNARYALFENPMKSVRLVSYSFLIVLILMFGVFDGGQFIYFQF